MGVGDTLSRPLPPPHLCPFYKTHWKGGETQHVGPTLKEEKGPLPEKRRSLALVDTAMAAAAAARR